MTNFPCIIEVYSQMIERSSIDLKFLSHTTCQVDYDSDEEEEEVGPAVKAGTKSGGMFSMFSSLVRLFFFNTNTYVQIQNIKNF